MWSVSYVLLLCCKSCNASATSIAIGSAISSTTIGGQIYSTERCTAAYPLLSAGKWYKVVGNGASIQASLCGNTFYDTMVCASKVLQPMITFAISHG